MICYKYAARHDECVRPVTAEKFRGHRNSEDTILRVCKKIT
ncbi:Uncharacterized protein dnm_068360 [Desulfonema magnum]|uniref:Uncharacterized protein n=1 Tax=Desulfonema magnum TaxID=45655 RepID=A0A975BTC9_9BACT|nr:Uncharacterized protein dnm_068360 [Desulfonema magnum]